MKLFRDTPPRPSGTPRWAFMESFEVPSIEKPMENHFVRFRLVQSPWCGLFVHRFDNADVRTFHDHPWNFISVVLRGGYTEATPDGNSSRTNYRLLWPGSINRKRATDLHYIASLHRKPTWSLILVGKHHRVWGYTDDDGTWTRFDEHPNAAKFDEAKRARRILRAVS